MASTASPGSTVRALAWDPTGTSSLSICPIPSSSSSTSSVTTDNKAKSSNNVDLDVFLSHDGTGCPPLETECLLKCLDAREEWMGRQTSNNNATAAEAVDVTKLSMDYRAALCECLMMLHKKNNNVSADNMMNDKEEEEEGNNVELLSLTYAISHLSELFLLPSLASPSSYAGGGGGGFRDSSIQSSRLDGPSGSLTADTVRYLRLHHSSHRLTIFNEPQVMDMLQCDQPEYYKFPSSSSIIIPGPYEYPYWNLLLQFVMVGDLFKTWTLLSYHSACRHAEEEALASGSGENEQNELLSNEGQGFAALRSLLLSAPLPGGRGDRYCDDAGLDDYLEEEMLEKDDEESRLNGGQQQQQDGGGGGEEDPGNIHERMLEDVHPNAYLLWEALPRHADRLRNLRYRRDLRSCGRIDDIERIESTESSPVMPLLYDSRAALDAFQTWQDALRSFVFPSGVGVQGGGGVLDALFKRFPALSQILSILVGVVPETIENGSNLTWSDSLLMELLYSRPDVSPGEIATRAKFAMTKRGHHGQSHALQDIVLSIMNGSAGQVVETMFSLCGGSSGAALPATMTSLLCNLLESAGCINPQQDSSKTNIQTELALLAAEAIVSSFSVQEQCDVGVRAAIRLLLPHAPPKRSSTEKDTIIYEPRIASMIAEVLSHRLPATDAEARDLLQLCEDAIQLGSVVIADACEALAFSRAQHHKANGSLTREVYWLLRGIEIQTSWLPSDRQGKLGFASRRHFDMLCEQTANDLISMLSTAAITSFSNKGLSENEETKISSVLQSAEDVLDGIIQDEVLASVLTGHVEANLLKYAIDIALADAKGDTVQVAADMVHCLEERCLSEDYGGVVSTLADPTIYTDLLHIAFAILAKEDDESRGKPMELAKCAFTIHGMHILMAQLTQVLSWEKQPSGASARVEYFRAMRLAFCKALMRLMAVTDEASATKEKYGEVTIDNELELMLNPCI